MLTCLARRTVGLPADQLAREVEHHVPSETPLLAEDAKNSSDAVTGGIARPLGLLGGAHVRADETVRQRKVVIPAAGLGRAAVAGIGNFQEMFAEITARLAQLWYGAKPLRGR
jgi:hypothetical protein